MLKSVLPNAGLWICPNTGHAINLEEPRHSMLKSKLPGRCRRGSWASRISENRD